MTDYNLRYNYDNYYKRNRHSSIIKANNVNLVDNKGNVLQSSQSHNYSTKANSLLHTIATSAQTNVDSLIVGMQSNESQINTTQVAENKEDNYPIVMDSYIEDVDKILKELLNN